MSVENIIDALLDEEPNVHGVAIVGKDGTLITQTENWDITGDLPVINTLLGEKLELGQK